MVQQFNSPKTTEPKFNTFWLPLLIGALLFGVISLFAWSLNNQQNTNRAATLDVENGKIVAYLENDLNNRVSVLQRYAKQWEVHNGFSQEEFNADAQAFINDMPGFQAIEWVDQNYNVRTVVPVAGNEAAQSLNLAFEENRRLALESAKNLGVPSMASPVNLVQGGQGFLIYFPIIVHGQFEGFVLAVFKMDEWVKYVLDTNETQNMTENLRTAIILDDTMVFKQAGWDGLNNSSGTSLLQTNLLAPTTVLKFLGHRFTVQSKPTAIFLERNNNHFSEIILLIGFLLSALVAYMVRLFQKTNSETWRNYVTKTALEDEIQEHQQTAGELQYSLSRLDMATKAGGIGIWSWHVPTNFLTWNERMFNIYDMPPDIMPVYDTWRNAIHPDDRQATETLLQNATQGKATFNTEFRILLSTGEVRYLGAAARVERDFTGKPLRVNGINWDLTPRKQMEIHLSGRVKELTCLNEVGRLVENQSISEAELCQQTLERLVDAMQFNQTAEAVIELDGRRYQSANYTGTQPHKMTAPIRANGLESGQLSVYYTEDKPIWLLEEQNLLENIVSLLSLWFEKEKSEVMVRRLTQAVEQSPVSIVITDTAGNIEYVNPQFCELTGYSLADVIGKNPRILKSDHTSREEYKRMWETILSGKVWYGEFRNRKKNHEFYWEKTSISPMLDENGNITHFLAMKENITEGKIMEGHLRQSESQNLALLSAIPDLMFRIDHEGIILDYKATSNELLIVPADKIIGYSIDTILDEDSAATAKDCIERALESEQVQSMEFSLRMGNSTRFYESRFKSSGVDEVIAIIRDISERMRLEQMKTDFINRATHEMRTPVTTMLLMVNLIDNQASQDEFEEYWGVLKSELNRERLLIETLLSAGHLESDQFQFNFRAIEIDELIKETIRQLELSAREKNIVITMESLLTDDKSPHLVNADENALTQVFINIIGNAIKFTPAEGKVHIQLQSSDSGMQVSIIDTGIGIPSEDMPMMFNRFFRGSNAIVEEIQGTGLGLFIVRAILDKHGGNIHVTSEPGKGSQFDVWLPVSQEQISFQSSHPVIQAETK